MNGGVGWGREHHYIWIFLFSNSWLFIHTLKRAEAPLLLEIGWPAICSLLSIAWLVTERRRKGHQTTSWLLLGRTIAAARRPLQTSVSRVLVLGRFQFNTLFDWLLRNIKFLRTLLSSHKDPDLFEDIS